MANLEGRDFLATGVEAKETHTAEVISDYLLLTDQQYLLAFGTQHRTKDPKVPSIYITNHHGAQEKVWVFRDEESYRRLRVCSKVGEVKTKQVLHPDSHLHEHQGEEWLKSCLNQRLADTNILAEILCKNPCLSTISGYKEKLNKRQGVLSEQSPSDSAAGIGEGIANQPVSDDDDEEGSGENDEEEDEEGASGGCTEAIVNAAKVNPQIIYKTPEEKKKTSKPYKMFKPIQRQLFGRASSSVSIADVADAETEAASEVASSVTAKTGSMASRSRIASPDAVGKWITKLSLDQIINGAKLGVSIRHAETASCKMQNKEKLQLIRHIKLAKFAAVVSAEGLESHDMSSIFEAIENLKGKVAWPEHLAKTLYDKKVVEYFNMGKAAPTGDVLQTLWTHSRPHSLPDDVTDMDLRDLKLFVLPLGVDKKVEAFGDLMVSHLLQPLVSEGDLKEAVLKDVCAFLMERITEDLLHDMDEKIVMSLVDLQVVCKSLHGLIDGSHQAIMECQSELKEFQKEDVGCPISANVFIAVKTVPYYSDKLDECTKLLTTLEFYEKDLQEVNTYLSLAPEITEAELMKASEELREVASLAPQLPESLGHKLEESMLERAQQVWLVFKQKLVEGAELECNEALHDFIAEAQISFSSDPVFQHAMQDWQDLLAQRVSAKSRGALLVGLGQMHDAINKESVTEDILQQVQQMAREAAGAELSTDEQTLMVGVYDALCEQALHLIQNQTQVLLGSHLELLKALQPWVSKTIEKGNKLQKLLNMSKMLVAVQDFVKGGDTLAAQCEQPQSRELLAVVMRKISSTATAEHDPWGTMVEKALDETGARLLKESQEHLTSVHLAAMRAALAKASATADGTNEGTRWDHGLAMNASYDIVVARAETTIMKLAKQDIEQMELAKKGLKEALDNYVAVRGFFGIQAPDALEAELEGKAKQLLSTKLSGMLLHVLQGSDERLTKRRKCQALLNQVKTEGLAIRACITTKASKAISLSMMWLQPKWFRTNNFTFTTNTQKQLQQNSVGASRCEKLKGDFVIVYSAEAQRGQMAIQTLCRLAPCRVLLLAGRSCVRQDLQTLERTPDSSGPHDPLEMMEKIAALGIPMAAVSNFQQPSKLSCL
eukprot:1255283-Amphidinium_carterae.2